MELSYVLRSQRHYQRALRRSKSAIINDIKEQALEYSKTIDSSLVAGQTGISLLALASFLLFLLIVYD